MSSNDQRKACESLLQKAFYTGSYPVKETQKQDFGMRCIYFREIANRIGGFLSSTASGILRFWTKYNRGVNFLCQMVYVGSTIQCPATFRGVLCAWDNKPERLVKYLNSKNIKLHQLLHGVVEADGMYIQAFFLTIQCYRCSPEGGPFIRTQPTGAVPGRGEPMQTRTWLRYAKEYDTWNEERYSEEMEKVLQAGAHLLFGTYDTLQDDQLPYGIGGHVSRLNFKCLFVMTGLHLPNGLEDRTDYDDYELNAIEQAKNSDANPKGPYYRTFQEKCIAPFQETVTGSWTTAFKCVSSKLYTDLNQKHYPNCTEVDMPDKMDREGDVENVLCASTRGTPRSDPWFDKQDHMNITGANVVIKCWNKDNLQTFRQFIKELEEEYKVDRSEGAADFSVLGLEGMKIKWQESYKSKRNDEQVEEVLEE